MSGARWQWATRVTRWLDNNFLHWDCSFVNCVYTRLRACGADAIAGVVNVIDGAIGTSPADYRGYSQSTNALNL